MMTDESAKASVPTDADWAAIHKKAFTDPAFRTLFETDPTAAVKQYATEHKKTFTKIVNTHSWIDTSKPYKRVSHPPGGPTACC